MPFKSVAQQRFMYANHPQIAKRWEDTYGVQKNLPYHAKDRKQMPHVGFNKLAQQIAARGSVRTPNAVAAAVGRHKYGPKQMAQASAKGQPLSQQDALHKAIHAKRHGKRRHQLPPQLAGRQFGRAA